MGQNVTSRATRPRSWPVRAVRTHLTPVTRVRRWLGAGATGPNRTGRLVIGGDSRNSRSHVRPGQRAGRALRAPACPPPRGKTHRCLARPPPAPNGTGAESLARIPPLVDRIPALVDGTGWNGTSSPVMEGFLRIPRNAPPPPAAKDMLVYSPPS